jgi:AP-4 complex subunit epsilon-1
LFKGGCSEHTQTLKLLNRIDANIIASYCSQVLQNVPSDLSVVGKNDHAVRVLELLGAKSGEDGEFYAHELINLFVQLEGAPLTGTPVLEAAVESVLLHLRNGVLTRRYSS